MRPLVFRPALLHRNKCVRRYATVYTSVKAMKRVLNKDYDLKTVEKALKRFDSDGNGVINMDEFTTMMQEETNPMAKVSIVRREEAGRKSE